MEGEWGSLIPYYLLFCESNVEYLRFWTDKVGKGLTPRGIETLTS